MKISIETNEKVLEFANRAQFAGWYIDFNGCYCCIINNMLFCVFVNFDTEELEFTIDGIGENGGFDVNYEWETLDNTLESVNVVREYVKRYQNFPKQK